MRVCHSSQTAASTSENTGVVCALSKVVLVLFCGFNPQFETCRPVPPTQEGVGDITSADFPGWNRFHHSPEDESDEGVWTGGSRPHMHGSEVAGGAVT